MMNYCRSAAHLKRCTLFLRMCQTHTQTNCFPTNGKVLTSQKSNCICQNFMAVMNKSGKSVTSATSGLIELAAYPYTFTQLLTKLLIEKDFFSFILQWKWDETRQKAKKGKTHKYVCNAQLLSSPIIAGQGVRASRRVLSAHPTASQKVLNLIMC